MTVVNFYLPEHKVLHSSGVCNLPSLGHWIKLHSFNWIGSTAPNDMGRQVMNGKYRELGRGNSWCISCFCLEKHQNDCEQVWDSRY